jgi:uncharacterized protein YeaO (DUF488 family)
VAKDAAPSTELRKWYGHLPDKLAQFESHYRDELATPTARAALDHLRTLNTTDSRPALSRTSQPRNESG